jgi:protein ImuB
MQAGFVMLWLALLPSEASAQPHTSQAAPWALAVVVWALGFTPRVMQREGAVLMELSACLRLWGGWAALRERLAREAVALGVVRLAWAPFAATALALGRAGVEQVGLETDGTAQADPVLWRLLAPLPVQVLGEVVQPHQTTLATLGCHTLGSLRRLPRNGVARRFGVALLRALDLAHGQASDAYRWEVLPAHFEARRELPWRLDNALALVEAAQPLLLQLQGWLMAQQAGALALTLGWTHDTFRARGTEPGGGVQVRTAHALRDMRHLSRLLSEHLAQLTLAAPVAELRLRLDEAQPLPHSSASWLPDPAVQGEALQQLLERLAARLGEQRVLRPQAQADHRPEQANRWVSALAPATPRAASVWPSWPQPVFLLPEPQRLGVREHRPQYRGALELLLGPQRVEGGWWHRDDSAERMFTVFRDYWVAQSPQAGVLCVFRTRLSGEHAWYLHGFFA